MTFRKKFPFNKISVWVSLCLISLSSYVWAADHDVAVYQLPKGGRLVRVSHNGAGAPMPLALVLVLDVSGSMDGASKNGDEGGDAYSRLDIVKYGVNTVIGMMSETDVLRVITFSDDIQSEVASEFVAMSGDQQRIVSENVLKLSTRGSTNLWGAIVEGLEQAAKIRNKCPNHNVNVVVLSDGEPNVNNPGSSRGDYNQGVNLQAWEDALKSQLKKTFREQPKKGSKRNAPVSLNMIGIGNDPNPDLLAMLSEVGGGVFNYMSDGSMIRDVVANMMTNMKCTATNTCWVGDSLVGRIPYRGMREWLTPEATLRVTDFAAIQTDIDRHEFISLLAKLNKKGPDVGTIAKWREFRDRIVVSSPDIAEDIEDSSPDKGQVLKAINSWGTWGKPYIAGLLSAHRSGQATNSKDATMARYHSQYSWNQLNEFTRLFESLPQERVPKPSRNSKYHGTVTQLANSTCLGSSSMILMEDGSTQQVGDLRPGQKIKGGATIRNIVRSHGDYELYKLGSAYLTPWHPFRLVGGKWEFPREALPEASTEKATVVYNLILTEQHYVESGNVQIITLGNGIAPGDEVGHHPFYSDMEKMIKVFANRADSNGFVDVYDKTVERDSEGRVSNFQF